MPVFGNRPDDVMQDKEGNAQVGVAIVCYATQSDASNQVSPLATATTVDKGRWPVTINGYDQVWARDPAGNIWAVVGEDVVGTHGTRLTTAEANIATNTTNIGNKEDKRATFVATGGDDTAALNAFLAASTPLGVKKLIGDITVSGALTCASKVYLDASKASVTQTATNVVTLTLSADDSTLFGGEWIGKGSDYVAGGSPLAMGVSTSGTTGVKVTSAKFRNFSGAAVRGLTVTDFRVTNNRIIGVGSPTITSGDASSCYGILVDTNSTGIKVTGNDISETCQGIIMGLTVTHVTLASNHIHDIRGQHATYLQNGTGLNVSGHDVWNIPLNGLKVQLSVSSASDSLNTSISGVTADNCGDVAVTLNNTAADLTSAKKFRGVTISGVTATNCARALYLGSIRGGTVSNINSYSATLDAFTVIDCQDLVCPNWISLGSQRLGLRVTTQTGAANARITWRDLRVVDPAGGAVASNTYGVQVSGVTGSDGVDLTFTDFQISSSNANMDYGFYFASGDQETLSLRGSWSVSGATAGDIRLAAGPRFCKEFDARGFYTTSLNLPVQGGAGLDPALALNNLVAETFDAALAGLGQAAMTAGVLYAARIFVPHRRKLSTILYQIATAGATLTAGQNLIGLYDSTGALIAQTADQSTNFGGTGNKSAALVTPVTVPAGSYLHVGVLFNGTTSPAIRGFNGTGAPNINLTAASQSRYATGGTAQTALPSTMPALTANNAANSAPWFGIA